MAQDHTLPAHRDNLLGICHAMGETFGFNPLYLRLVLLVAVMLNAQLALTAYGVAGVAVLVAKLATRSSRRSAVKPGVLAHA